MDIGYGHKAHEHFVPALKSPFNAFGRIGVVRVFARVVVAASAQHPCPSRDLFGNSQAVAGLPVEIILRHGKESLSFAIRI